jgi:hypothetical protein
LQHRVHGRYDFVRDVDETLGEYETDLRAGIGLE